MRKMKVSLYCYLTAGTCILTERLYKCLLSSQEVVQIPHSDVAMATESLKNLIKLL